MDDFLGSDDDDDDIGGGGGSVVEPGASDNRSAAKLLLAIENQVFIELMKLKPFLKKVDNASSSSSFPEDVLGGGKGALLDRTSLYPRYVLLVDPSEQFRVRVKNAKFNAVVVTKHLELMQLNSRFDIICYFGTNFTNSANCHEISSHLGEVLAPSGRLFIEKSAAMDLLLMGSADGSSSKWDAVSPSADDGLSIWKRRQIACNQEGAIYWTHSKDYNLADELARIESVTLAISESERLAGVFSDDTHRRAVDILQKHGVCIFPQTFDKKTVMHWGKCALQDMKDALDCLRLRDIDLFRPGQGPRIENFYELSMREALRCDLRNGRKMVEAMRQTDTKSTALPSKFVIEPKIKEHTAADSSSSEINCQLKSVQNHAGIGAVLLEIMNPFGEDAKGNWGRWNFESGGPMSPPTMQVGNIGAVISLPGCADQTIHADCAHTFVHTQLPGHYFNLFLPAVERDSVTYSNDVGQTLFVTGSHILRNSAHIMCEEGGQQDLERRLIRPQLSAGDALIFDCRILHFGLHNKDTSNSSNPSGESSSNSNESRSESNSKSISSSSNSNSGSNSNSIESSSSLTSGCAAANDGGGAVGGRWRPLLYINHHQPWFHDPKNWNDREKLFPENNDCSSNSKLPI